MVMGKILEFEVFDRPAFSYIRIHLKKGQNVQCEGGTMIFFDPTLEITTKKADKSVWKSLKRTLAGETFLMNEFTANDDGYLGLTPPFPGDLMHLPVIPGKGWTLFSGAFVASTTNLVTNTSFQGLKKGFFSGERAFVMTVDAQQDPGDLFIGSYGSFFEINLEPGQVFNCDNGHLVAMESSIGYDIKRVGNWKSTLFSGEGLITEMRGPGRLIMQSRNAHEFAMWIYKYLPKSNN